MKPFLNDQNFFCIDNFYFLCIFSTFDEQTFFFSDKVWFILKDATQIYSLFYICMPQIKTNKFVHQS